MRVIIIISGIIILVSGIPDDFSAVSSLNSPMLPKVIRDARSIASGRAVGTKESENWKRSSARIVKIQAFACKFIDIHPEELQQQDDKHDEECEYQRAYE